MKFSYTFLERCAICVVALCGAVSFNAQASDGNQYRVIDDDHVELVYVAPNGQVAMIPYAVDSKSVTSVAQGALRDCTAITTLTIGGNADDPTLTIHSDLFDGLTNLNVIYCYRSLEFADESPFQHIESQDVTLSIQYAKFPDGAFKNMTAVTSVVLRVLPSFGHGCFEGCSNIREVKASGPGMDVSYPDVAEKVRNYAADTFDGINYALCKLTVPQGGVTDNNAAFYRSTAAWGKFYLITDGVNEDRLAAKEMTFKESKYTVNVGESITLEPTIEGVDVAEGELSWSSSDNSIAIVDNGIVTAVSTGSATISAIYTGSGIIAEGSVAVEVLGAATAKTDISLNASGYRFIIKDLPVAEVTFQIVPDSGEEIECVALNGVDITADIDDKGMYTTEAATDLNITVITKTQGASQIAGITQDQYHLHIRDGRIIITGADAATPLQLIDLQGRILIQTTGTELTTAYPQGTYILKIANATYKIKL